MRGEPIRFCFRNLNWEKQGASHSVGQGVGWGPGTGEQSGSLASCSFFFKKKKKNLLFCTKVQLINNVVMVSGEQQRDSATHTHVYILP